MARIFNLARKSTLALRQRKAFLLQSITPSPDFLRASVVERFSVCGKRQCHCRQKGAKHGPYYYLTQCLAVGKINKFLLKTPEQQQDARTGVEGFHQVQDRLEELSQINAELLRRGERLLSE